MYVCMYVCTLIHDASVPYSAAALYIYNLLCTHIYVHVYTHIHIYVCTLIHNANAPASHIFILLMCMHIPFTFFLPLEVQSETLFCALYENEYNFELSWTGIYIKYSCRRGLTHLYSYASAGAHTHTHRHTHIH